jgi:hypothetical protein
MLPGFRLVTRARVRRPDRRGLSKIDLAGEKLETRSVRHSDAFIPEARSRF